MADIDFTTSLNDKGFSVGMKNIEKQAAKSAKAVDSMFKLEVMAKLGQGMSRLIGGAFAALAKESTDAAAALREVEQVQQRFMAALGAELLPLLQQALGLVRSVGSGIGDVWRGAIDQVAVGMRMLSGEDYAEALANVETLRQAALQAAVLDRQIAALKAAKVAGGGTVGTPRRGSGDTGGLADAVQRDLDDALGEQYAQVVEMARVEDEREKRMEQLARTMEGLTAAEREQRGEAEMRARIDRAAEATLDAINAKYVKQREEQRKAAAEQQHSRDLAWEGVQLEAERLRIENLRLAGMGREAEAAQRRMEWAERAAAIDRNALLTDEQRARAKRDLADIAAEERRLAGDAADREYRRRMGLDGGSAAVGGEVSGTRGLLAQVFGPAQTRADVGPAASAAAATAKNTARTAELLQRAVDRGEFATRGAVFA